MHFYAIFPEKESFIRRQTERRFEIFDINGLLLRAKYWFFLKDCFRRDYTKPKKTVTRMKNESLVKIIQSPSNRLNIQPVSDWEVSPNHCKLHNYCNNC